MRIFMFAFALALASLPAVATPMLPIEECWYKYNPAYRDWKDAWEWKLRDDIVTMAQASRAHKHKWGEAGAWVHREGGGGDPPRCRKYLPRGKLDFNADTD